MVDKKSFKERVFIVLAEVLFRWFYRTRDPDFQSKGKWRRDKKVYPIIWDLLRDESAWNVKPLTTHGTSGYMVRGDFKIEIGTPRVSLAFLGFRVPVRLGCLVVVRDNQENIYYRMPYYVRLRACNIIRRSIKNEVTGNSDNTITEITDKYLSAKGL